MPPVPREHAADREPELSTVLLVSGHVRNEATPTADIAAGSGGQAVMPGYGSPLRPGLQRSVTTTRSTWIPGWDRPSVLLVFRTVLSSERRFFVPVNECDDRYRDGGRVSE
jgi:hypothetical protein